MIRFLGGGSGGGAAGSGLVPTVDEPFTVDNLATYVATAGSSLSGLVVSGGMLASSDGNNHEFRHTTSLVNGKHIVKIVPGVSGAFLIELMVKYVDSANQIKLQVYNGGGSVSLFVATTAQGFLVRGSITPPSAGGKPMWIVARLSGNEIVIESWRRNPALGGDPEAIAGYSLITNEIVALGDSVAGYPGLALAGYAGGFTATDWKLDDWIVVSDAVEVAGNRAGF